MENKVLQDMYHHDMEGRKVFIKTGDMREIQNLIFNILSNHYPDQISEEKDIDVEFSNAINFDYYDLISFNVYYNGFKDHYDITGIFVDLFDNYEETAHIIDDEENLMDSYEFYMEENKDNQSYVDEFLEQFDLDIENVTRNYSMLRDLIDYIESQIIEDNLLIIPV